MADYWVSQGRKHCDFCDCWIADNRPSIDFHERGKRHTENVEKKIAELRKKGLQQAKDAENFESTMKKIEEAALKKFQEDIANDPVLSAKYKALQAKSDALSKQKEEAAAAQASSQEPSQERDGSERLQSTEEQTGQVWYEGTTDEGAVYYFNSVTQESRWEKPPDFDGVGYQQDASSTETNADEASEALEKEEEDNNKKDEEEDDDEEDDDTERKPFKRKASAAYGTWTTIEREDPVDLQLPGDRQGFSKSQQYVPRVAEKKPKGRMKFQEKTIESLATTSSQSTGADGGAQVGFKKRKFGGNVRKRDKDA